MSVNSKRVVSNPDLLGRNVKMSKTDQDDVGSEGFNSAADALNTLEISSEKNSDEAPSSSHPLIGKTLPAENIFDNIVVQSVEELLNDDSQRWGRKDSSDLGSVDKIVNEDDGDSRISRRISAESNMSQKPIIDKASLSSLMRRPSHGGGFKRNKSESTVGSRSDYGWFDDVVVPEGGKDDSFPRKRNDLVISHKMGASQDTKNKMLFHDIHDGEMNEVTPKKNIREGELMAVTAPTYILEESQSSQSLWKHTAGTRPPQPVEERAFFEQLWAQNFQRSQVEYNMPSDVLTALSPLADGNYDVNSPNNDTDSEYVSRIVRRENHGFYGGGNRGRNIDSLEPLDPHLTIVNKKVKDVETNDELTIVVRGDNVFGTTVSKSFPKGAGAPQGEVITVSISIASYRVVESKKHGKYAQYLVIFCEGNFRDTVGVWKRYSDFERLSERVTRGTENCTSHFAGINPLAITEDHHDGDLLPNAVTSWKLLKKRQRWFRCLDAGYLSLKAFLLERFLHDILFESSTPDILREFILNKKKKK